MKIAGRLLSGRAWRECSRCGFQFPMNMFIRQNGRLVCTGPETTNCHDEQGRDFYLQRAKRHPRREGYDVEPTNNETVI